MASRQIKKLLPIILLCLAQYLYPQFKNTDWVGKNGPNTTRKGKERIDIDISLPNSYIFKFNLIGGTILPLSENLKQTAQRPIIGGELCIEFPSWYGYAWQQYWGDPTIGVAVMALNLGNPEILGYSFATYPYLLVNCADYRHFQMNYKIGAGISFFTQRWNTCDTLSGVNAPTANSAIGSILNAYITTGFNFNFPIKKGFALNADLGYMHMSNGSMLQPNGGINILYASIGGSYRLNKCTHCKKSMKDFQPLPYKWSINIAGASGTRELYYRDNKSYVIGMIHVGATYNIVNWYALGIGADIFYDGVFMQQGTTPDMSSIERAEQQQNTHFNRYLLTENRFANKLRAGIGINNEFKIGRLTALLDWGIYLYDPIRNAHPTPHPKYGNKRPMFYSYDINKEDGWNYFRLGLRCRVWNNLSIQASIKTHLQKAEMLEWGLCYTLPFKKRQSHGLLYSSD